MLLLTISEVSYWRTTRVEDHLFVDKMQADRDFNIVLDFSFHALACKGACAGPWRGAPLADAVHSRASCSDSAWQ